MARRQVVSREMQYDIQGLREFRAALKALGEDYPEQLKAENKRLADTLIMKARARAAVHGGVVAKGARSMKATNNQKFAAILGGSTGSLSDRQVFFGAEFGGKRRTQGKRVPVNSRGPRKQKFGFKPWRGNQFSGWAGGPGYFLNPTIRDDGESALQAYFDGLRRLERRAFPD